MTLEALIAKVLADTAYDRNPYFVHLADGTFAKDDFVATQMQFFSNVVFFSRPMAALAGKIPSPEMRVEILKNVWEEHGEGTLGHAHGNTFLEFLKRLDGVEPARVDLQYLWPEVRIFNTLLAGATVLDDYLYSVAVLGIVERMFSDISAWIGRGVVARGWMTEERLIHYKLHQDLDIKHSEDFFALLRDPYARSELNRYHVEQGLRVGATIFNGLYEGLWRGRARRWTLARPMPPSRTADDVP